ncbi:MAG: hypothetical protein ACK5QX_04020 [bacterium]|jgi:hypothetical protein
MFNLTADEIAGLDAIHAEYGRKWRSVVEKDWYNGTSRTIGPVIYGLRNRVGGGCGGLDSYAKILKSRKSATNRS